MMPGLHVSTQCFDPDPALVLCRVILLHLSLGDIVLPKCKHPDSSMLPKCTAEGTSHGNRKVPLTLSCMAVGYGGPLAVSAAVPCCFCP